MKLEENDDFFHSPTSDERWWTETYWFSFDDPKTGLSGTFYPLLRPNLDIAAMTVAIWSPDQNTAWSAPYYRSHWHLKPPVFDGNRMELEGLSYEVLEPLNQYRVRYQDGDTFSADLTITGITENHVPIATPEIGHWDQPTRVEGVIKLGSRTIPLDCFGMRDRSWGPRLDSNSARATYVYGINKSASFLVITQMAEEPYRVSGYLERDGKRGAIVHAVQETEHDHWERTNAVLITGRDEHDRRINIYGRAKNHIGKQASPGYYAWMSMFEWDFEKGAIGQFQDVWSPDRLSAQAVKKL
jgi:hypothetical protein